MESSYEICDNSDEEDVVSPPEFVQIVAPYEEVKCWISYFMQEKRQQIDMQNVQDFCVNTELRQNCARVDAVMVKRKGTTSHITVKDIKNYCGPQELQECQSNPSQSNRNNVKKKVFTFDEVEEKLRRLQSMADFQTLPDQE